MSEVGENEKIPLVIIGILLISVFFLFKGCEDINNNDLGLTEDLAQESIEDNNESIEEEEPATVEEEIVIIQEEPLPEFNLCGDSPYGLPSFEGTIREGEGCVSAEDCLLYPPEGYVGTIIIQNLYSSPLLKCCIEDGTCYW